jgi:hypothetical protein
MRPYKVLITHELFLLSKPSASEKQRIIAFLESLAKDPFQMGDYQETDAVGRPVQIKIIGKFALTFWADHSVEEVKVIQVDVADGR